MPLFFTISGYSLAINDYEIDSITALWKRIKREIVSLYVPYLSFVILYWIARFFASSFLGCQLVDPLETEMRELFHLLVAGKLLSWFLLSLLLVRIVFDIVQYLGNEYWCLGLFLVIAGINIVVSNRLIVYLSYGLFFSIGYIISRKNVCILKKSVLSCALLIIFLCTLGIGMIFLGKNSIIDLITAVILSTIPFLIRPNQEKTIYARLGKIRCFIILLME